MVADNKIKMQSLVSSKNVHKYKFVYDKKCRATHTTVSQEAMNLCSSSRENITTNLVFLPLFL